MLIAILPLVVASSTALEAEAVRADTPVAQSAKRTAQVQLADALASADTIDSISGRGDAFTFAITRGDEHVDVVVTTKRHKVVSVTEHTRDFGDMELANLSWLIDTMQETTAVTRLDVDEDGAVTLTTDEGMRYMAIPGRGSGGNTAAEARWAGEWNRDEG